MSRNPTPSEPAIGLEDDVYVRAYDQLLREHPQEALAHAQSIRERHADEGMELLDWSGWPLRPLFIPASTLHFVGRAIYAQLKNFVEELQRLAPDPIRFQERIPLPLGFLEQLDLKTSLGSPDFLSILRPDGFLLEDRFVLGEINPGNGTLISNAYAEVLHGLFQHSPLMARLAMPYTLDSPFQVLIEYLLRRLGAPCRLGLLAVREEFSIIKTWEARVLHQVDHAHRLLAAAGFESRVVFLDQPSSWEGIDAFLWLTTGESLLDKKLPDLGQDRPVVGPLATMCLEKGCLPALSEHSPAAQEFRLTVAATEYPHLDKAREYRVRKEDWVLKRAFQGKHTLVGATAPQRSWNRFLEPALGGSDYVIQAYQSLPRVRMPISPDGRNIEWRQVRVELSPFIIDGAYSGAIARYAPEQEGLVMSPPPTAMGMTLVCAT